jgi:hypothetical protein
MSLYALYICKMKLNVSFLVYLTTLSVFRSHSLRERAPGAHWKGGWVGPRTGLNAVEKRFFGSRAAKGVKVRRLRMVELYLHCPICLHGVVLN